MKIDIHAKNISLFQPLEDLIQKKVGKLENFHSHIMGTDVYLSQEGEGVNNKEVKIKMNLKSQTLIAKQKDNSFEKALDSSVESVKRQLKKSKQK